MRETINQYSQKDLFLKQYQGLEKGRGGKEEGKGKRGEEEKCEMVFRPSRPSNTHFLPVNFLLMVEREVIELIGLCTLLKRGKREREERKGNIREK